MNRRMQYKRGMTLTEDQKLVARPSKWGNPARISKDESGVCKYKIMQDGYPNFRMYTSEIANAHYFATEMYRDWLDDKLVDDPDFLKPLIDKELFCYCDPELPCHVDVLIEKIKEVYGGAK